MYVLVISFTISGYSLLALKLYNAVSCEVIKLNFVVFDKFIIPILCCIRKYYHYTGNYYMISNN